MTNNTRLTLGSLFDGIGGFPYAASFFGITPLWASEILPAAISVTRRQIPGMQHVGDITQLSGHTLPPVDIISFGSPCQGMSVAGLHKGLADPRSGLFNEAIRIIREMREATYDRYPTWAIWENVLGALSSNRGLDFRAVLEAFAETEVPLPPSGRWTTAGMVRGGKADIAWVVYNAQYFGTPQRRRRIFLVADFRGKRAGEILFVPKSLRGYFAAGGTPKQALTAASARGVNSAEPSSTDSNCLTPWDTQQARVFPEAGKAPTLAGADGGGGRNPGGLVFAAFCGGASALARGIGYSESVSPTLKSANGSNSVPCLCEPALADEAESADAKTDSVGMTEAVGVKTDSVGMTEAVGVHQNQNGDISTSKTAYTLATSGNASDRNAPLVAHPTIVGALCASDGGLPRAGGITVKTDPYTDATDTDTTDADSSYADATDTGIPYADATDTGIPDAVTTSDRNAPLVAHPTISGTLCASGAGLSRPGGMASETDLCVVVSDAKAILIHDESDTKAIPIHDKATRHNGGGDTRKNDGAGNGLGIGKDGDPAPTITSGDRHAVAAYCLQGNMIGRKEHNGPHGDGINKECSFTLTATDTHAVAVDCRNYKETVELSGTLQAKNKPGYSLNFQNPIRIGRYIVRRLTPVECERLQGFPDGWTAFGADGKPLSDSARYMMLGNSVAVPCVAYIMQGIAQTHLRDIQDHDGKTQLIRTEE